MTKNGQSLREQMPTVAGWVDEIRAAFGNSVIEQAWKRRDEGAFWARENGIEIGKRREDGKR